MENFMNNIQLYATFYHSLGMNVAPIYNNENNVPFKNPGIDIEQWRLNAQEVTDVLSLDWNEAVGLGMISGFNGFRAIDIDSFLERTSFGKSNERIIEEMLYQLELPLDYQWVVKCGSGNGYHIIFLCDDLPDMLKRNYSFEAQSWTEVPDYRTITYYPHAFKRLELSWNFFLVLPPSKLKHSKVAYDFWMGKIPTMLPSHVSEEKLAKLIYNWCGYHKYEVFEYNGYECKLYYSECETIEGSGLERVAYIEEYKGLLMACDEGRNLLAIKSNSSLPSIKLLQSSKCPNAKRNIANLIAIGYIEANYKEFSKFANELLEEKIIEKDEYDELEKRASKNCRQPNKLMFFDTETNGLIPKYFSQITDMPRVVQLSWIVADEDGQIEKECDYLIKPIDFDLYEDSIKVHGITKEKAMNQGIEIKTIISMFITDLNRCHAIVGHNISFDIQVIWAEFIRLNIPYGLTIKEMPFYCTMYLSVDYCKLPLITGHGYRYSIFNALRSNNRYNYKLPKLTELYEFLFNEKFYNAHDAKADIKATVKCFFELLKRNVITYKPTNKTYKDFVITKDQKSNILNENMLSLIERWHVYKNEGKWVVNAVLVKNRIIKVSLLYEWSSKGIELDISSLSLLETYALSQCNGFFINKNAIAVSKMLFARIISDVSPFEINDINWDKSKYDNKWKTKNVRTFDKEEQADVNKAEVVKSQYGNSVCFNMKSGGVTYMPLSDKSSLKIGACINLSTARLITLCRNGEKDIYRVLD